MIWFPELPEFDGDLCGILNIPEELDFDEFERPTDTEDEFIRIIIEVMSKPAKGGQLNG